MIRHIRLMLASAFVGIALATPLTPIPNLLGTRAVSPNGTCGAQAAGANNRFTCPADTPCCSSHGYCGAGDSYCLTTAGCQAAFSLSTVSCHAPQDGKTVSPDNTCGIVGDGKYGYRCPATGATCCSAQ
ncbi:hypothetical protein NKR23_g10744 [Pleurostoma richardsiae]|uniref:Chitin-binding type-1 domain-containing protein n=1 Tax=Pleurostoma richardsiae TaxID=41990 RepID=A0AA38R3Z6_9PEZI|nr:hypothetical protein NKR23_g10744 [Pleurostoma richardsiae]